MTCPCGGDMSTPIRGRRTGIWRSTCKSCGTTQRDVEPSTHAAEPNHTGMFLAQQTAQVRRTEAGGGLTPFDRAGVATAARNAILRARDGKARQVGSE